MNKNYVIAVLVIIVIGLTSYVVYDKVINNDNDTKKDNQVVEDKNDKKEEQVKDVSKIDSKRDWVYDAEYEYEVESESYTTSFGKTYSIDDIVVPYMNINSKDAEKVNSEIEKILSKELDIFKEGLKEQIIYVKSNYDVYSNDNNISVLLTKTTGGTDVPIESYYAYNFDLKTGKLLSYEDIYKKAGFTASNIESSVEKAITSVMNDKLKSSSVTEEELEEFNNSSIENYKKSVSDNTIQYFLDDNNKLNVVVDLEIPAGRGNFDTVITVE